MNLPADQQQALDRALYIHGSGNIGEAEKLYQALLDRDAEQPDALHYLGVIRLQTERFDEAVTLIKRAIHARPDYVDAMVNLGFGLNALGRFAEAIEQFEQALDQGSPNAPILANLGGALAHLGRYPEAVNRLEEALEMQPELAETRRSLADVLLRLGRTDNALQEIRKAATASEPSVPMQMSMGNILLASGNVEEAIECFSMALALRPDLPAVRGNLANLLRQVGRFEEAIEQYEVLLAKDPGNAQASYRLGGVFQDLGDREKAGAAFRKAVQIDANFAKAWHGIAATDALDDKEVESLLGLQRSADTSDDDRMRLAFALGRHFEKTGRHDEAATQLSKGNELRRVDLDYDIENDLRAMQNIRRSFDKSFFDRWKGAGLPDRKPIFIVGMPRSGTTLIEQILASHPVVQGAGELTLLVNAVIDAFPIRNGVDYTSSLAEATADDLQSVARAYLEGLPDGERVTDKLPHNFLNVGMIRVLFPHATIVHCKRDARDTCFSIYKHLFGSDSHAYAYDLEDLARYYNGYAELMDHWEQVMPGHVHTVQYEALVDNQEPVTRELLEACDLAWDPACLDFHKLERLVATISASQVRQPVYSASIGSWKAYEELLRPLLDILARDDIQEY